ncbi:MAG TPA: hypothetical protein VGZ72_09480 [Stellaceae bacterium]|nr:hypothetical protein [Stellaceae bacterium]
MDILKRVLLWSSMALAVAVLVAVELILWPAPLFAYTARSSKIVVASDQPIPAAGGERFLRDCERLLARSPLKAESSQYHVYVTNEAWRHRLFFLPAPSAGGVAYYYGLGGDAFLSGANFETGRLIKWGYVTTPPRTLAYFCAHELTHIIVGEHLGVIASERQPQWVHEGFPDYVGIETRESFEELRDALGDRPVDIPMMQKYGAYPRYRLLVTYFLEKKRWPVDELLRTKLTFAEAMGIMSADTRN